MIKSIKIVPRKFILDNKNNLTFNDSISLISIHNSDMAFPIIKNSKHVLNMWFDDIEPLSKLYFKPDLNDIFTLGDAYEIRDFVFKQLENVVEHFIVQCSAGISRSGAVGRFIQYVTKFDDEIFTLHNPMIIPNRWVLNLLLYILN